MKTLFILLPIAAIAIQLFASPAIQFFAGAAGLCGFMIWTMWDSANHYE